MSASSPSLATSAVKVGGVPRKLFAAPQEPQRPPAVLAKRKLPLELSSAAQGSRDGSAKENGTNEANSEVPTRRESRLKKLKSVKSISTDRTVPQTKLATPLLSGGGVFSSSVLTSSSVVSLTSVQGAALPPPLELDQLLLECEADAASSSSSSSSSTCVQYSALHSSDETLKQLAGIVARKKRGPLQVGSATPPGRPSKKARSLCGNEATKAINRRQGADKDTVGGCPSSTEVTEEDSQPSLATDRSQIRLLNRRASFDCSDLWTAHRRHEEAKERAAEDHLSLTTGPILRSGTNTGIEVVRPVPLWNELHPETHLQNSIKDLSTRVLDSPDQAEKRRRRSRSVGDLKQLLVAADEASAIAQQSATQPKKRERRRKRNSLVRAIDKLISVASNVVTKEEETVPVPQESKLTTESPLTPRDRCNKENAHVEESAANDIDMSIHGGTLQEIFHHVVVANWKHITSYESHVGMRQIVWRDRSLVLNFLFGLRRWKISLKDLFILILEEYHFGAGTRVADHISRNLDQERKDMKVLRQKLAALVHVWILYFYKSEKEKRFVGRFLDLLKRDGLQEEVKEIQIKIWNACQEQDKLQAIQKLTPQRRTAVASVAASPMASPSPRRLPPGSVSTQNPIYSASPVTRRPASSLRPSASVLPKSFCSSSTPGRTPLRAGQMSITQTPPRTPSTVVSSGAVCLLTLSTTAVAKQLSRIEYDLFRAVPASEFMDICKSNIARPSLSKLVDHTNKISYWVATQIVTLSKSKDKVKMLNKLITLAEKCLRLRNFASASSILIGLNLSLISRMKDVWEALPSKQLALFEKIKAIPMADANYRRLRALVRREKLRLERLEILSQHVKDVDPVLLAPPLVGISADASSTASNDVELTPPVIPFMAIYNKDFTFVEEQPNQFADGRINYDKMQVVGSLLREIHLFQHQLSSIDSLESDPVVDNYLANITCLSEDTLWSLSGIHTSLRS